MIHDSALSENKSSQRFHSTVDGRSRYGIRASAGTHMASWNKDILQKNNLLPARTLSNCSFICGKQGLRPHQQLRGCKR